MSLKFSEIFKIIFTIALIPLKDNAATAVVPDSQVLALSIEGNSREDVVLVN